MTRCAGIKRDGGRCEVVVSGQQPYCYHHDPATAEKRKRVASKGGRSKPNRELADIKRLVGGLVAGVLKGTTDRADAAVCGQLLNTQIRCVAVELKVREQLELIERLESLESVLEHRDEGGWHRGVSG
jgi:hypothetical protein